MNLNLNLNLKGEKRREEGGEYEGEVEVGGGVWEGRKRKQGKIRKGKRVCDVNRMCKSTGGKCGPPSLVRPG